MVEDLLDVFSRGTRIVWIVLGTCLTDCILNSKLHKKYGYIPFSRAIVEKKLGWLGHVLQIKDASRKHEKSF
jgi:hypothetical protein